jgi:hypothetical protein
LHFIDAVVRAAKKRDAQTAKVQQTQGKPAPSSQPGTPVDGKPRVSLAAHVSHTAIAQRAGVDPKVYREPRELNERRWTKQPTPLMTPIPQPGPSGLAAARASSGGLPSAGATTPGSSTSAQPKQQQQIAALLQQQQLMQQAQLMRQQQAASAARSSSGATSNSATAGANAAAGSPASQPRTPNLPMSQRPPGSAAGGSPMTMTQQQVQQFLQRQALLRQSNSPQQQAQELLALTQAQINQMPAVLAQRVMIARQQAQQAMMAQQQRQAQQAAAMATGVQQQSGSAESEFTNAAGASAQAQVGFCIFNDVLVLLILILVT